MVALLEERALRQSQARGMFVSLYRHPKNGVLAIVSNLGKEKTHARIQFHLTG